MSEIKVDKFSKRDGSKSVGADYVIDGSAKARVSYNHNPTTTIRDSFNVSSHVDHGTGHTQINFINAFQNDGYSVGAMGQHSSTNVIISGYYGSGRVTVTGIRLASLVASGSSYLDVNYAMASFDGELAQ
ncbi:hypothetical protein [Curvivirga aplysinae]|uniref:hypothetical protein n=1 Tax=Curvivirga aplysinae TaxID=2529852 RepID=UPI0012BCA4B8|nr:hypothetical protein [Curvivirga aplysinae]MTI08484.1 hypothetical protein [Curvivirga aplysinae]